MKHRAERQPDGSVIVDGTRYRLEERGERFVVVRAEDGGELGAFRVTDVAHGFEIETAGEERAVVEAVARVFAAPRGLLPLQ
jgi:hypothetical protein